VTRIYLSAPDVTDLERSLLLEAFDSGWISTVGPALDVFEAELAARAGTAGAVAVASGTAGLHLALLALGVGPGDEVITSSFTFVATANAIVQCGATPVFVDSDAESWNMSPVLLAEALGDAARRGVRPAAVLVVDLYGQCADYARIAPLCEEHGVPLVEDAAEALGASAHGRPAGSFGRVGVFSFNGNKIATTSGGGAVVSNDLELLDRVRHLANQAREPVLHYEHREPGFNYRLSNLAAAVGVGQLQRLDNMSARRRQINNRYQAELCGTDVHPMPVPEWSSWNGWLTSLVFDEDQTAERVRQVLEAEDIESRPLWKPMHLQPVFAQHRVFANGVSRQLFETGQCLPSSSGLSDEEVSRVIDGVQRALAATGESGQVAS
jgi:dTDP-4-amino-4,6-dideoxygalactose transaminase